MRNINKRSIALSERAVLYRTLALGFSHPAEDRAMEIREALAVLGGIERHDHVMRYLQRCRDTWQSVSDDRLAADHARLFADTGPISLYETAYHGRSMASRARALADISGLYQAFGFRHREELPDHIEAELAFLGLLLLKESYARTNGLRAQAAIAARATAIFLKQHLGRWVDAFELQIAAVDAETPYYDLAALLAAAVGQECRRRRVRAESAVTHLEQEIA